MGWPNYPKTVLGGQSPSKQLMRVVNHPQNNLLGGSGSRTNSKRVLGVVGHS